MLKLKSNGEINVLYVSKSKSLYLTLISYSHTFYKRLKFLSNYSESKQIFYVVESNKLSIFR